MTYAIHLIFYIDTFKSDAPPTSEATKAPNVNNKTTAAPTAPNHKQQNGGVKASVPKATSKAAPNAGAAAPAAAAVATAAPIPHNRYWNFEKNDWSECNTSDSEEDEKGQRATPLKKKVVGGIPARPQVVAPAASAALKPKKLADVAPPTLKILNTGGGGSGGSGGSGSTDTKDNNGRDVKTDAKPAAEKKKDEKPKTEQQPAPANNKVL